MDSILLINGSDQFLFEKISKAEGFEFPTTRIVMEDIPNRNGSIYIGSLFGRRRLAWDGFIEPGTHYTQRRSLQKAVLVGSLKTMQFTTNDDLDLQASVEIENIIMPYRVGRSVFHIEAVAPDWRFYSQTEESETTDINQMSGGMAIPAPVPSPIGGSSSEDFIITNDGNANTNPTLTIQGPGTNFLITNVTTGEELQLNLTLTNTESVIIDTLNRTATLGNQNVFGSVSGDWLILTPGNNRILFNASSGTTGNTLLTVAFRHAYLGI